MIIDNCYVINPEDAEEVKAANEAILKIREERQMEEMRHRMKVTIGLSIDDSIAQIGLAETKIIVRELNRKLRELK